MGDGDDRALQALAEIRTAEAGRILGLLPAGSLVDLAAGWAAAGITSPGILRLAFAADVSNDEALGLLASDAAALGLTFSSTRDARAAYVVDLLPDLVSAPDPGTLSMTVSNNYTDEISGRARGLFGRFRRRR
ncbi:hypothetical protein GCM10025867_06200 [Frondihabitans sucicola]|uniref:DUF4192 family protein n=1 Tax=Frondihabitans sucicola TaxID=1268041 RepID=A0ABM8GJ14_9MICO|nr:hypothetical protein [Frondihabitans sucicola]BDZ48379.1 hypothetical protein GCM10025867_06200 [Frondihabitans sucicola]